MNPVATETGGPAFRTTTPEQTAALAAVLAPALRAGDVLSLNGPLGSGKTCFVEGLARGLAVSGAARSPSFTLVHAHEGAVPMTHVDLYRLEARDVDGLGLEEAVERGVLVVEWGERLGARLLLEALTLRFAREDIATRTILAEADAGRGLELLAAWRALGGVPHA